MERTDALQIGSVIAWHAIKPLNTAALDGKGQLHRYMHLPRIPQLNPAPNANSAGHSPSCHVSKHGPFSKLNSISLGDWQLSVAFPERDGMSIGVGGQMK